MSSIKIECVHLRLYRKLPTSPLYHDATSARSQISLSPRGPRCSSFCKSTYHFGTPALLDGRGEQLRTSLATLAKMEFGLSKAPNKTTIFCLLTSKSKYVDLPPTAKPTFKSLHHAAAPRLQSALYTWLCDKTLQGAQINGAVLRVEVERLQSKANKQVPPEKQLTLNFLNRWLSRI